MLFHVQEGLLDKVVSRLALPDGNLQTACTELLKNVAENRGERYNIGQPFPKQPRKYRTVGNAYIFTGYRN